MKKTRYYTMTVMVLLLPVIGATAMYLLIFPFNLEQASTFKLALYSIVMICLGLLVPYCMLKAFSVAAHEYDEGETELELKDIPKDKAQMDRKTSNQYASAHRH